MNEENIKMDDQIQQKSQDSNWSNDDLVQKSPEREEGEGENQEIERSSNNDFLIKLNLEDMDLDENENNCKSHKFSTYMAIFLTGTSK